MSSIATGKQGSAIEVLLTAAKLGLTSFGGPIAHLGYFHDEYVRRRRWLDERTYADLVALSQFLPGPASSQVQVAIGAMRAGLLGGLMAWVGFTLPSAVGLALFAYLLKGFSLADAGWIHGLKVVAVVVVAQAVLGMGQKLAADRSRATIAVAAACLTLLWQSAFSQVLLIAAAGLIGWRLFRSKADDEIIEVPVRISRKLAMGCLALFFGLLVLLPVLRQATGSTVVALFDSLYRSGSLVFGGGHVVLPLLEQEVVSPGWVSQSDFLAGYGAAQAVPGPLFTIASYIGAVQGGLPGALVALVAIFLPALLLIIGALPFWGGLRRNPTIQGALTGINAAVVGILLAALYHPLWTSAIRAPVDFALASVLFLTLQFWRLPPWVVVLAGALGGVWIH